MIYELLSTALLACSLGSSPYKHEAINSNGDYYATSNDYPCDTYFACTIYNFSGTGRNSIAYDTGNGNLIYRDVNQGDRLFIALPNGLQVTITNENTTAIHTQGSVWVNYNSTSYVVEQQKERIWAQYDYLQEHSSTDLITSQGMEVNELTGEIYPEMSFIYSVDYDGESPTWDKPSLGITFQKFFKVSYTAFGCTETNASNYYKINSPVALRFNALEDYGFYYNNIANYRQVREENGFLDTSVTTLEQLEAPYNVFGSLLAVDVASGFLNQDVSYKVASIPLDLGMRGSYADGYEDGTIEGQTPVSWIRTTFDGIAGFFNIQVFPFVTLGFICFAPLIVVAIVAILRIIKHD